MAQRFTVASRERRDQTLSRMLEQTFTVTGFVERKG